MTTPSPTPTRRLRDEQHTSRMPAALKRAATTKAKKAGHPDLSSVTVALLEAYVAGTVDVPSPPAPPADPVRVECGRRIVVDGLPILAAAQEAGLSWPTARKAADEYRRAHPGATS